jgi:hypothetical protein
MALAGLAALVLVPLAGCVAIVNTGVKGSGVVKTQSHAVADFSSIALHGVGKVTVKQTGREALSISAEDNLLPLLEVRVADGTLTLKVADGQSINPTKPIEFTVEVKDLDGLSLSGAGSIEASQVKGKRLAVSLSGAGDITASGDVEELEVTISGAGSFKGAELAARRVTARSSGVGSAVVNASDELDASVSGVGSVEYVGAPKVQKSVTGVGTVKKR